MILIEGKQYCVSDFEGFDVRLKNYLYSELDKGNCIIKIPEFVERGTISQKAYKVGFLFDLLSVVYPNYTNVRKYLIIDQEYHLFLSHKRLLDLYKKEYVGKYG